MLLFFQTRENCTAIDKRTKKLNDHFYDSSIFSISYYTKVVQKVAESNIKSRFNDKPIEHLGNTVQGVHTNKMEIQVCSVVPN